VGVFTTEYLALLGATVAGVAVTVGSMRDATNESTTMVSQSVTQELRRMMPPRTQAAQQAQGRFLPSAAQAQVDFEQPQYRFHMPEMP